MPSSVKHWKVFSASSNATSCFTHCKVKLTFNRNRTRNTFRCYFFHAFYLKQRRLGSTWLVIKKQTNAEIKAVMSPLQEAYSCTNFLSYFVPLPSVSEPQYSWSCLGGSGAQCSPFVFSAVLGFESCFPLPVTWVWLAGADLCAGRVVWLW